MKIELKILEHAKEFYSINPDFSCKGSNIMHESLPSFATQGSAGMDLRIIEDVVLYPGENKLVGTGIAIHIGSGNNCSDSLYIGQGINHHMGVSFAGFIFPRSGLGHKGLILGNGTGVIDEDYKSEIKLSLLNRSLVPIQLSKGDRVAQLVFLPVIKPEFTLVNEFSDPEIVHRGFNSTGKS